MMSTSRTKERALKIYSSLVQYPILSEQIRARMRQELFNRGIISDQTFEAEVRAKAIRSQAKEGLNDPLTEEPADIWELRLTKIRDSLTDNYFATHLPYSLFDKIVKQTLQEVSTQAANTQTTFNPELAPLNTLFEQALAIEKMPESKRYQSEARLQEIKVVLIRTMISDQLGYVKIAKDWFTISDLNFIRSRKISSGKIGGKSAGMMLAYRILQKIGDDEIRASIKIPESFFIGADLTYTFMAMNGLMHWSDQKYKLEDQIRTEYPKLHSQFLQGKFPLDILERFKGLLRQVGKQPIIVRSSSLLEDNFGTSFAGKYESFFCPNQGNFGQNLHNFTQAIKSIYASSLNPDALLYRREKGLQDYDERMAILIQVVEGERFGHYFMPHAAGVGFSRNLYRWSPQIRRDAGFLRLVWGLGTRAVDRVGEDYPRLVALSHPLLHPESSPAEIQRYCQKYVDLIDLEDNQFKTLPIREVLTPNYPLIRLLFQREKDGYLSPLRTTLQDASVENLVLTFEGLLKRTPLASRMSRMLQLLEKSYHTAVDTEFALYVNNPSEPKPEIKISILQCRPQSHLIDQEVKIPHNLDKDDIIFSTKRMAPRGYIKNIKYVLFVPPESYFALPSSSDRARLAYLVSQINTALADEIFICVGPGRWGTINPDLGVPVGYGDIYNTRALVELTGKGIGNAPEASFGTHFFQDLVESNIYPLAIYLDDQETIFKHDFFYNTPNCATEFVSNEQISKTCLRLIEVSSYRNNYSLELIMDDEEGRTVAFLKPN